MPPEDRSLIRAMGTGGSPRFSSASGHPSASVKAKRVYPLMKTKSLVSSLTETIPIRLARKRCSLTLHQLRKLQIVSN